MSSPTLYYTLFSSPSRACILTAKLINLDLELKTINFVEKENHSEWFLKINPRHTVPVLVDEGVPLCDSHAILSYMISKYAPNDSLYPKNLIRRAKVDELLYFENGVLFQCIKSFVGSILYGSETEFTSNSIELCHKAYEFLEQFLLNSDFVAGNHMTIADVSINTTLITLNKIVPVNEVKYPKIYAWIDKMKNIPNYNDINEKGACQLYTRILNGLTENRRKNTVSDEQIE